MRHTQKTQVLEAQSWSLPLANLHPHHPHTSNITLQSLSLSFSHTHTVNPSQHHDQHNINNNHKISLTGKSERGQLCATPGRRKCLKSRVSHFLLQNCIHTIHTQVTSHRNHSLSLSLTHSHCQSIATQPPTHTSKQQSHNITHRKE